MISRWKIKAGIQNVIAALPVAVSQSLYYWLQRNWGALRTVNPVSRLSGGIEMWRRIKIQGHDPKDKVFLEIGTGWTPFVPLAFWLMGAKETITIDLNCYIKAELVWEGLQYVAKNEPQIRELFGDLLDQERMGRLLAYVKAEPFFIKDFLDLCCIRYVAPGDGAHTGLKIRSVDYHVSHFVFEHISPVVLRDILKEGSRVIKDEGLFIHRIDYSDHFSKVDSRITSVNFLQFSDAQWQQYAGNRFMYMNRLRHDDFLDLYMAVGQSVVFIETDVDPEVEAALKNGRVSLDVRFRAKPAHILAVRSAWIVAKKNHLEKV